MRGLKWAYRDCMFFFESSFWAMRVMGIVLRFISRFILVAGLCIGNIQTRLLWGIKYAVREGEP